VTLGFTVLYLSLVVLLPLAALVAKVGSMTASQFWTSVT
jgi:sulfate transport system permease protein